MIEFDISIPVEFFNPKRRVNKWCIGYLQPEKRIKNGLSQCLIFFNSSPSYFVWVDESNVFRA